MPFDPAQTLPHPISGQAIRAMTTRSNTLGYNDIDNLTMPEYFELLLIRAALAVINTNPLKNAEEAWQAVRGRASRSTGYPTAQEDFMVAFHNVAQLMNRT